MKNITKIITLILYLSFDVSAIEYSSIEILFFKQPSDLTIKSQSQSVNPLPDIDPSSNIYFLDNLEDLGSFQGYQSSLEKKGYKIINYQRHIVGLEEFQANNFIFTNSDYLKSSIDQFDNSDYLARQYFDKDTNVISKLKIRSSTSGAMFTDIHANLIEASTDDILQEKRKIKHNEINYFDSNKFGILLLIKKSDPPKIIEEILEDENNEEIENVDIPNNV